MKITKAVQKQLQSTAKCQNIIIRGKVIWIDFQKNGERLRKSTKLKYSPVAFNFVKKNYEKYLEKGAEIWLKKEFVAYENELTDKRLLKKDAEKNATNRDDYTLNKLIDDFLNEKAFLKGSSKRSYKSLCSVLKNFFISKNLIYVFEIQRETSIDFTNYLLANNVVTLKSLKWYFSMFNSLINLAVNQNLISKNPLFHPKISTLKDPEKKPFSLQEVELMLKNATGLLKTYLYIAFFTGMRTGEILALTWGDIDFEKKEIKVTKTIDLISGDISKPKTASSFRTIDLLDILAKELFSLKDKNDKKLFSSITIWRLRAAFKSLVAKLKLDERKLYDTRHTFASIMLSRGEEPMWVGCKMLGHKSLNETFKSYAKYLPKDIKLRAKFLDNLDI